MKAQLEGSLKNINSQDVKSNKVMNFTLQEVPDRKLSCGHNADKSPSENMHDKKNGLVKNTPSISPFSRHELLSFQSHRSGSNIGYHRDGLSVNSKSPSTPLRLRGGGETSLENVNSEYQCDGPFVNLPIISTPFVSIAANDIFPVSERINMSWENSIVSDTISTISTPQALGTPKEISDENTLSSIDELDPMTNLCIPPSTNLNPLAEAFIPILADSSFSDQSISFPSNQDLRDFSIVNCSSVNQDDSMSEQDIREILHDAGYAIEDINHIITSKSNPNESAGLTVMEQSVNASSREPPERNDTDDSDVRSPLNIDVSVNENVRSALNIDVSVNENDEKPY